MSYRLYRSVSLILLVHCVFFFFFSSRRRHTRFKCDWSSDVCSSDLAPARRNLCQTICMARGWESKDVEAQVAETEEPRQKGLAGQKTPEELMREQERKDLQLSRTRIPKDLASSNHPNHPNPLQSTPAPPSK